MKKVLGISMIALLAVAPFASHAAGQAKAVTLINGGNSLTPTKTVASTTYVQGAYNTLGTQINNIISDSTVPSGTYNAIANNKNVAENLVALDAAIDGLNGSGEGSVANAVQTGAQNATYNANTEYGLGTIGKAIQEVTTAADNNTAAILLLNGDVETSGSVANSIATETNRATSAESDLSARIGELGADGHYIYKDASVATNLSSLDTAVDLNTLHIGSITNLSKDHNLSTIESRSTLVSAINTLDAAIDSLGGSGSGSVAEQVQSGSQNAEYNANGTYAPGTIGNAIKTNANTISGMQAQTIDVVTTWGDDDHPTPVSLFN